MAKKSEDWTGFRVRLKVDNLPRSVRVGVVVERYSVPTWWRVEWPDGSRKLYPQRDLIILSRGPA